MIVDYDKETDTVYISKQIDNRWIQVGLNRDEVNQIVRSNPYNPQSEREKVLDELIEWCKVEAKTYSQYYLTESGYDILATFEQKLKELRQGGE